MELKNREIKKVSMIGILFNFILLVLKLVTGFVFRSQAMIADGLNSAGDIFASAMSLIGNKIASKPRDADHPYGHGKAEYIFSQLIGISMLLAAVAMLYSAIESILVGAQLSFSYYLIGASFVTMIVKFSLFLYTRSQYLKFHSILLRASMEDHRNDMLVTTGTIIGIVAGMYGWYSVDGWIAIGTSIWIGVVGIKLFKSSYDVLMDKDMDATQKAKMEQDILAYAEVIQIDHFLTKPVGDRYLVILKITMEGELTLNQAHALAGMIKCNMMEQYEEIYDMIIHMNPNHQKE